MNNFKRNIYRISNIEDNLDLEISLYNVSSLTDPDTSCAVITDTNCWVNTQNNGVITTGDTIYLNEEGSIPFNGDNLYYKVTLVNGYILLINNIGEVSVYSICA